VLPASASMAAEAASALRIARVAGATLMVRETRALLWPAFELYPFIKNPLFFNRLSCTRRAQERAYPKIESLPQSHF
jgi:hypothetical protein